MINKNKHRRRSRRQSYIASAFGIPVVEYVEIGREGSDTVVVKFSANVLSSDYADGVIIKVNDAPQTISGAVRQDNHSIIFYTIPEVVKHDAVTWEYSGGDFTNEIDNTVLGDISPVTAINNVPPTTPVFISGEVLNPTEIAITFSEDITLGSGGVEKDGVIVTINEVSTTVISGIIVDEIATYTLLDEIVSGDDVTFGYNALIGSLQSELDNIPVPNITPQVVTNGL